VFIYPASAAKHNKRMKKAPMRLLVRHSNFGPILVRFGYIPP